MTHESLQRIAVVGLGLIGGSLVQSLRRALPERTLLGVDYAPVLALAGGFLDEQHPLADLPHAVANADLIFLATPINAILDMLPAIANAAKLGAIVTDVGSTKHQIVEKAKSCFSDKKTFIGGHPMAGLEKGGWENAQPHLFENCAYVLTPTEHCPAAPLAAVQELLAKMGTRVMLLDAEEHDRVAAEISHLPQLLAVALTNFIARAGVALEPRLQMAARGLRDMTRIAASPYDIWCDILQTNRANVQTSLQQFIRVLQMLEADLARENLEAAFQNAKTIRGSLL
ncbi:MAG: prephenate dehydrogenase/arogenate dehydrogenase family protein [candidate division KSB1 bacterium]